MILHTASEIISFAKKLENESAKFYGDLSQKYSKDEDIFLSFVKENTRNVKQIERVYYGVITDAIEGCFAFNIEPDQYMFKNEQAEETGYPGILGRAIEMEEKIIKFYMDAAGQSKSLMADVPRTCGMIAKKRGNRKSQLISLLGGEG